jgi:peptide/nickel transport system substrate-binding protein
MDAEIKKLTKRTLLVTVCLLVMLSPLYAAPSSVQASTQSMPRYGGTLRIAYGSDPIGWNPVTNYWSTSMYYYINTYAKAFRYDDLYNQIGYACIGSPVHTSTTQYPSIWTFEMKEGITFQDGVPLTVEDIKFTYETHAWGASADAAAKGIDQEIIDRLEVPMYHSTTYFGDLAKIETSGNSITLYFTAVSLGDWISDMNTGIILPQHLWKDFNKHNAKGMTMEDNKYNSESMPGSGPFQVVEYERDQYTIMDRYDDYFDGVPYLEHLVWNVITDPTAGMLALENHEVDSVHEQLNFPLSEIARVNSNPEFTVVAFPYTTTWRVTPNFSESAAETWPWLADVSVRQALEYAIDKQTIVDNVLFGNTKPTSTAVSWIVAPYGGDYNTIDQGYTGDFPIVKRDYDPDMARQLLTDAGWDLNGDGVRHKVIGGTDYTIDDVEMPYYHYATAWAEAISKYWRDIGIHVAPIPIESTTFFQGIEVSELGLDDEAVGGPYPLGLNTMGGGPDPDSVNGWIRSRPAWGPGWLLGGDNFGFYSNERVDELFDIGASTADYASRKAAYDELQKIIHDEAGFVMLWNKWKVEAWNNEFAGFGSNRPIAWYGGYFHGTDESSNVEKGVYWRGGTETPDGGIVTVTVPEFMDLRVIVALGLFLITGVSVSRRRRKIE